MADLRRVLYRGYFPINVPQPFSTTDFARLLSGGTKTHPGFLRPTDPGAREKYELAEHNLARVGQLRRVLGIPNPVPFYTLAMDICTNWSAIDRELNRGSLSVSRPIPVTRGARAFAAYAGFPDRGRIRARRRVGFRYVLFADVQKFYPSVYTHAVPWALHTKAVAKQRRNDRTLLGNRLDGWIRDAQDAQSVGLPIGPDTSWILSELVLTGVDRILEKRLSDLVGIRSVDDYELYFRTPGEAEEALAILQTALAAYGLALNQHKTRIENLPVPLEDTWPMKLRDLKLSRGPVAQISGLLAYFSEAFELAQQHPTASVLRFALSRVRRVPLHGTSWQTFQDLLFQCAVAEPGTLQYVLATLRRWQRLGHAVDGDRFQETVAEIISKHLPLAHGSEVAWALWASVALSIPLANAVIKKLPRATDPLVPILALHAESIGLAPGLNKARWQKLVVEDELYGPNWLLVYEGTQRNWLSPGPADPIKKHRAFKHLRSNKVSFYRSNASAEYIPPWRRSLGLPQLIGYGL